MSVYENWVSAVYDQNGTNKTKEWDKYLPLEQKIYEQMLTTKNTVIKGTVSELADKHGMSVEFIVGFLDGINEALDAPLNVEEMTEDTQIDATLNFERLYKKMVEFKAEHLYSLPEWNSVFSEEDQKRMYLEQKSSTTVRREEKKIGRNDPCPCGNGKKYKKCCGI
jgi:hypothetical protein